MTFGSTIHCMTDKIKKANTFNIYMQQKDLGKRM